MKNKVYYISLVMLFFLVTVNGQSSMNTEEKVTIWQGSFTQPSLKAYQENSKNKIKDFYQYLNIIADQDTPLELNTQAKENIYTLFNQNKKALIPDFLTKGYSLVPLDQFLEKIHHQSLVFEISEQKTTVFYDYWMNNYNLKLNGKKEPICINQQVSFLEQPKKFGEETKNVWSITLGNLNVCKD